MSLIPRNFYLDDIFEDFNKVAKTNQMKCDIYEKDGKYNIEMDIPGFDKQDIRIECQDGILSVTAEKNSDSEETSDDKKYLRRERFYGKVSRSFTFNDINEEAISAEFNNGILKIAIPKTDKTESKKVIEIN